jgi:hypothetical protein
VRLGKGLALVVVAILSALLAFSGGCNQSGSQEAPPDKPPIELIELMKKVPVYYDDFTFWDVRTLQDDSNLGEIYKVWQGREGEWLGNFGIKSSEVNYLVQAEVLTIAKGEFNLNGIRDSLASDYYHDTDYKDVEVWVSKAIEEPGIIGGAVALMESLFIWGNKSNIDDFISVVRGEEPAMYDSNAAELMERLPSGIVVTIWRDANPEGVIVAGRSYEKKGRATFRCTEVYKFENREDVDNADEYFKEIEKSFRYSFTLKQDGKFVEWNALVDLSYLISILFYD